MTLRDIVEKYDGDATFAVSKIIPGGTEAIVEFSNSCHDAIKDEIMLGTVNKYAVSVASNRAVTVKVTIDDIVEEAPEETPEDVPSDDTNADDGTDAGA